GALPTELTALVQLISELAYTISAESCLCARQCANAGGSVAKVGIRHDRVAPVNALGPVARNFHRHRPWHPSLLHSSHGGSAQIVNQHARYAGLECGRAPGLAEFRNAL